MIQCSAPGLANKDVTATEQDNDVVNLALASRGSTITGSNGTNWSKLIDGVKTGYTASTGFGYTVYSTPAGWMTLDLKGLYTITRTKLLLWDRDNRYYRYKIEASSNNTTWTMIVNRNDGDESVSGLAGNRLQPGGAGAVLAADWHIQQLNGEPSVPGGGMGSLRRGGGGCGSRGDQKHLRALKSKGNMSPERKSERSGTD